MTATTDRTLHHAAPPVLPNGEPRSLVEIVEHEALGYRAWRTPAGDFLAAQMDRLGQLIRWTGARTPEDHEDRMELYDRELRDRYFEQGFAEGLEQGRKQSKGSELGNSQRGQNCLLTVLTPFRPSVLGAFVFGLPGGALVGGFVGLFLALTINRLLDREAFRSHPAPDEDRGDQQDIDRCTLCGNDDP
jgi:hypothetical protein